jgi:hypothetical protein
MVYCDADILVSKQTLQSRSQYHMYYPADLNFFFYTALLCHFIYYADNHHISKQKQNGKVPLFLGTNL